MKQLSFIPQDKPKPKFFGGALLNGRRKRQRPLSFRKPIHIVIRASLATGRWSFVKKENRVKIERWLAKFSLQTGTKVYEKALVSNHIHMVILCRNRKAYCDCIRALTGTLPRSVFRFQHPTKSFFDHRPFSRIIEWGRDYKNTCSYVIQNALEALGVIPYKERGKSPYDRFIMRPAIS